MERLPSSASGNVIPLIVLAGLLGTTACNGPERDGDRMTLHGEAQGTTFNIKYIDPEHRDLTRPVDSLFRAVDAALSLWDPNSTVSRFNAATDTFVTDDALFLDVLGYARADWVLTAGAFDPTVYPLVKAWGFGPQGEAVANTSQNDSLRHLVGLSMIFSDPPVSPPGSAHGTMKLWKRFPGIQFDPNGIAQGYTVDRIAERLESEGIHSYMVEVGGEVRAHGTNATDEPWSIGIDKPEAGSDHDLQTTISLKDASIATSGNYRKFREVNGQRVGHTIDPRTGKPVTHGLLSVSVLHRMCTSADALATGLLVMGPDATFTWSTAHPDIGIFLVLDDGMGGYLTWASKKWPGEAQFRDERPTYPADTTAVQDAGRPMPSEDPASTRDGVGLPMDNGMKGGLNEMKQLTEEEKMQIKRDKRKASMSPLERQKLERLEKEEELLREKQQRLKEEGAH
ncbi:MAG: FAD:protein FMN transferase [Flavobacteriales bacterium]|nr:FAD:protein FMN transferase [Flavobacteriales bacterium]